MVLEKVSIFNQQPCGGFHGRKSHLKNYLKRYCIASFWLKNGQLLCIDILVYVLLRKSSPLAAGSSRQVLLAVTPPCTSPAPGSGQVAGGRYWAGHSVGRSGHGGGAGHCLGGSDSQGEITGHVSLLLPTLGRPGGAAEGRHQVNTAPTPNSSLLQCPSVTLSPTMSRPGLTQNDPLYYTRWGYAALLGLTLFGGLVLNGGPAPFLPLTRSPFPVFKPDPAAPSSLLPLRSLPPGLPGLSPGHARGASCGNRVSGNEVQEEMRERA